MATIVHNGNSASGYDNTRTVPSFTPGADRLLILDVYQENSAAVSTITGHGTWSLTPVCTITSSGRTFARYALVTSGSPSAAAVTVTWASSSVYQISCCEVIDADVSGGSAAAFVQHNCGSIYNGGGAPFTNTFPLSAFASPTNLTLISGTGATGKEAAYTNLFTGSVKFETYYLPSEDTTPSYQSTGTFQTTRGLASEIKEAAAPGGVSIPVIMNHLRNQGIS